METINQLQGLDYAYLLFGFIVILSTWKLISSLWEDTIGKLGLETKGMRKRRKEHNLLIQTSDNLNELQKKYSDYVEQTKVNNDEIKKVISDINSSMEILKNKQNELINTVNEIVESNKKRDEATIEEMCDRICQKIRYYINVLQGIPEDEYDDFIRFFETYEAIGGNHGAKEKYEYCLNHLSILPVKKEVIVENK